MARHFRQMATGWSSAEHPSDAQSLSVDYEMRDCKIQHAAHAPKGCDDRNELVLINLNVGARVQHEDLRVERNQLCFISFHFIPFFSPNSEGETVFRASTQTRNVSWAPTFSTITSECSVLSGKNYHFSCRCCSCFSSQEGSLSNGSQNTGSNKEPAGKK